MRLVTGCLLALSIFTAPLSANAGNPVAKAATVKQGTGYQTVMGADRKLWVDRTQLPTKTGDRLAVLRRAMEDEIVGHTTFTSGDTPTFEIVSHGATLVEKLHDGKTSLAANHDIPIYEVKASELSGGKLKTTLLLPVSGHVGLAEAQRYAKSNVFEIKANGQLIKVPAKGFVTDYNLELQLKPGRNTITAEPYHDALTGYEEGRTIYIDVK